MIISLQVWDGWCIFCQAVSSWDMYKVVSSEWFIVVSVVYVCDMRQQSIEKMTLLVRDKLTPCQPFSSPAMYEWVIVNCVIRGKCLHSRSFWKTTVISDDVTASVWYLSKHCILMEFHQSVRLEWKHSVQKIGNLKNGTNAFHFILSYYLWQLRHRFRKQI